MIASDINALPTDAVNLIVKALGGAYAAEELQRRGHVASTVAATVTASAGNHGIGLAWGCRRLNLPRDLARVMFPRSFLSNSQLAVLN